jgi:prepilin-type N-terminal cleavage/methylation domain-containing protein
MRPARQERRRRGDGFTLTELAIVMAIVAFLLGGLMYTLSAQTDQRNFEETRRRLDQARELILAFAIVNGRLPCPATAASAGDEAPAGGGTCTSPYGGFVPARAIGYQQVDSGGFAVDIWGNRLRYAVANLFTACTGIPTAPHFTNSVNLRANGISCQPNDLLVCKSANPATASPPFASPAITATTCGGAANQIMSQSLVTAIVFSTGKNGTVGGTSIDEAANLNGDRIFVFHTPTPLDAANGEFDDQFTWITVGELYGRMISAGLLP